MTSRGASRSRAKPPQPAARREVPRQRGRAPARGAGPGAGYGVVALFGLVFMAVDAAWGVPAAVLPAYLVASTVCFVAYAFDKWAAQGGRRRTPERTLWLLGLLGGWPGALLAQQWLRHKSSKAAFRRVFWATVALNMAAFVLLCSSLPALAPA